MTDRLPLFSPVQYKLVPDGASGQRPTSAPPPTGSTLITSAPSCAKVKPPSGAATKLETSRTVSPSSGAPAFIAARPLKTSTCQAFSPQHLK